MATRNPFELLVDDENDDPSVLIARVGASIIPKETKKVSSVQQPPASAKLPTKPLPPSQAVRESRGEGGRGRGRGAGRGNFASRERGLEGDGYNRQARENGPQGDRRDYNDRSRNGGEIRGYTAGSQNGDFSAPRDDGEGRSSQNGYRGRGRGRGHFVDGQDQGGRRFYDRRSGSGRGYETKREGAGRGNWGTELDQSPVEEVVVPTSEPKPIEDVEKKPEEVVEGDAGENKEIEEEDKEMTLEEYEKVLAEKRKGLVGMKAEERKVAIDKDFESMQLVDKKVDEDLIPKMGSDKGKKKELLDKEEKARKSMNINEFLRPAEGEFTYGRRGRGGRGRGSDRGGFKGGFGRGYNEEPTAAPHIEDPAQFPSLGGK
ncbi:hypothetical protein KP509_19G044700 [Ceratopteris richardii]|uniref:Hyaluronan/mRNA-binding protein domain-containing protein n=1 Tax=Ceratopteris richardii TaxID=49495 RepID=A0A8T2SLS6_CERRI|nr:hypothetical protein KP509_19G044700 [Ceratopteris richardii]